VTSNLAPNPKLRNHGRGRDGQVSLLRRVGNFHVFWSLIAKLFDIWILPGISGSGLMTVISPLPEFPANPMILDILRTGGEGGHSHFAIVIERI